MRNSPPGGGTFGWGPAATIKGAGPVYSYRQATPAVRPGPLCYSGKYSCGLIHPTEFHGGLFWSKNMGGVQINIWHCFINDRSSTTVDALRGSLSPQMFPFLTLNYRSCLYTIPPTDVAGFIYLVPVRTSPSPSSHLSMFFPVRENIIWSHAIVL